MKFKLKIKGTFVIGMGITFLVMIFYYFELSKDTPFLRFMELKSLDLKFQARGKIQPGNEVIIAVIDDKSIDELGLWPWSRDIHAKLVEKLTEYYKVRVIAYDVIFSEPDSNPGLIKIRDFKKQLEKKDLADSMIIELLEQVEKESDTDQQFANALKKSGNTILGYFFRFSKMEVEYVSEELMKRSFFNIIGSHYNAVRFSSRKAKSVPLQGAYAVESSITVLSKAAAAAGYFSFFTEADGAIRKIPLIVNYKKIFFPPLSVQALRLFLNKQISVNIQEFGVERIKIGDIVIPTDARGRLLINYYGPQNTFPHYSITDILHGRIPEDLLKDKIALIGTTAFGIQDLRVTPFQAHYPGVEIHATVIDNILHERFIIRPDWADVVDLSAIFIIGFLFTFFLAKIRIFYSLIGAFLFGALFVYFNYKTFQRGYQVSMVYPLLNLLLVYGGITIYRYFREERDKRFIKSAFGQYLAPAIIDRLIANPESLKLGGEQKVLTVFFSDLVGFSTISEKLSAQELVELLNILLTEMTDIIMKYEGTVDKFEGDSIMAFYGAPLPLDDHARRACLASLDMQKRLDELRRQWKKEGRPELFMRIGLNTGSMVIGNMGSKNRMNYTIMGDSVNLASRLEGANKQYGTFNMISESTYNAAKDFVEVRKLDTIRVVGKSEPVAVYELICKKGELTPAQREKINLFTEGLAYYLELQWDKAIKSFQTILKNGDDAPSLTFIKRCEEFKIRPPVDNAADELWDGVYSLTEK